MTRGISRLATEIQWLFDHPTPLFLACVDKTTTVLCVSQTMPRLFSELLREARSPSTHTVLWMVCHEANERPVLLSRSMRVIKPSAPGAWASACASNTDCCDVGLQRRPPAFSSGLT